MNKIPVRQTIAEAYRFTFVGLERVIGVIWLPIIIMTVGEYFISGPYLSGMANAMESGDSAQVGPLLAANIAFYVVRLVLMAVIGVAITREILAPLQRPLFLRFSLGGAELRTFSAIIGLYVLLIAFVIVCTIIAMVLAGVLGSALPPSPLPAAQRLMGIVVLIALLFSPLLIYLVARLSYLIVPSAVMDGGFGIERSWQLTKGNVWRIIGVSLAVTVPIVLVMAIIQLAVLGPEAFNPGMGGATDKAMQARQMRAMAENLPLLKGLEFVLAPFLYGLTFSAPAFAFKALVAPAKAEQN